MPNSGYRTGAAVKAATEGQAKTSKQFCPAHVDVVGFDLDPLQDDLPEVLPCSVDSLGDLRNVLAAGDDAGTHRR